MNAAAVDDLRARLHSTIGGSSETELKLLAVRPMSSPSTTRVVTTVTPVVNEPRALRNCLESMIVVLVMSSSLRGFESARGRLEAHHGVSALEEGLHRSVLIRFAETP